MSSPPELPLPVTPSWKRLALLPASPSRRIQVNHPPPFPGDTPPLVTFYSFKGGVGRTVHLCALLRELSERKLRALIIDADLEAPGVSLLAQKDGRGVPEISLVDVLALAHGEPDGGWPSTVALCAERLRRQPLRVGAMEHYLLATYRDEEQALRLDIRPEHLTQTPQTAWHLGELFVALARKLGVAVTLIDLRAGLSELASPLLFDSRIHRVLVTTAAVQSREGTRMVLGQLGKLMPPEERQDLFDPEVFVTMLNDEQRENQIDTLLGELEDAYATGATEDSPATAARLEIDELHHSDFYEKLQSARSLSHLIDCIRDCGLGAQISRLVEQQWIGWFPPPPGVVAQEPSLTQARQDRKALREAARTLEYAEGASRRRTFLTTAPLRALAQRFEAQAPLAVILGQKGAGKTFLFLQIVASTGWTGFVEKALERRVVAPRFCQVWPLLWPRTLNGEALRLIQHCAAQAKKAVHAPFIDRSTWELSTVQDRVAQEIKRGSTSESDWRTFWFTLIIDSLGITPTAGTDPVRALVQFVQDAGVQLAVLADGLEEIFTNVRNSEIEQAAVRALLQGVPERLREVPHSPLGLLLFVRHDVAATAVRQNFGQFERSYEPFVLRWSAEEALRLALWLVGEDARLPVLRVRSSLDELEAQQLREALYPLWGYKLGPPRSREARSADYVLGALADFQGRIQARDLVRLIQRAAELSERSKEAAPLLVPRAIREALDFCGQEKLRELLEEIAGLRAPVEKLRTAGKVKDRRSPFDPRLFALSLEDVQLLEVTGLVKKDGERYWLSELLRRGLGFPMREGKRPRIVNL